MIGAVTVIGCSVLVVVCLSRCANASGTSTMQQARVTIVLFIVCLLLMLTLILSLQRDSEARAARNFDFFLRGLLFFCALDTSR
jgi:hypothetical protein